MPEDLIQGMLSSLEYQQVEEGNMMISIQEEFHNFYLIRGGAVQVFDRRYGYMYSLEKGSHFGETNLLLGLYSEQNYKALTMST